MLADYTDDADALTLKKINLSDIYLRHQRNLSSSAIKLSSSALSLLTLRLKNADA